MCRTFSVQHTETIEHIETYQMCCTFIVCVTLLPYVSLTWFGECAAACIHWAQQPSTHLPHTTVTTITTKYGSMATHTSPHHHLNDGPPHYRGPRCTDAPKVLFLYFTNIYLQIECVGVMVYGVENWGLNMDTSQVWGVSYFSKISLLTVTYNCLQRTATRTVEIRLCGDWQMQTDAKNWASKTVWWKAPLWLGGNRGIVLAHGGIQYMG